MERGRRQPALSRSLLLQQFAKVAVMGHLLSWLQGPAVRCEDRREGREPGRLMLDPSEWLQGTPVFLSHLKKVLK